MLHLKLGLVMSIRTWSFTRLWAVAAGYWLAAIVFAALSVEAGPARLLALILASVPAFLAGAWAGSHAEIRDWPIIRLVAIWVFPAFALFGASGTMLRERTFVAAIVFAPILVLTVRWFELRGAGRSLIEVAPPAMTEAPITMTTPRSGTPIS